MAKEYVRFTTRIDQWKDLFNDLTNDVGDIALLTTGDFVARGGAQGRTDITLGYTFSGADSDLVTAVNELDYRMDSTDDLLDQAVLTSSNVNFNQITVGPWNNGTPTATNPLYTIAGVSTTNALGYTIDATYDIILDADGANVTIKDNGVTQFDFSNDGTNKTINVPSGNLTVSAGSDIYLKPTGDDIFMQGVTSGEQIQFNLGTATQSITASDDMQISAGGDIYLKPTGDDVIIQGTTSTEQIKITAGDTIQTIEASDQLDITSVNNTNVSAGGDIYLKPTGDTVYMQGVTSGEQLQFQLDASLQTITASDALSLVSTGNTTIDASGDIILDAAGADVLLKDAGTQYAAFTNNSGNLIIKSGSTTAATFNGADVTFASNVYMTDSSRANSNFSVGGNGLVGGNLEIVGNTIIYGNTDIGDATTDTVSITARLDTDFVPSTNNTRSLGTSSLQFKDLFVDGIGWIDGIQADSATITGNLDVQGITTLDSATVDGDLSVTLNATVTGNLTVNGNTTIGDNETDTLTINARLASHLVPSTNGVRNLGTQTLQFKDIWINGIGHIDGIDADSAYISANATVNGNLTVNGNTTIGDATTDDVTVNASIASSLIPKTDNLRDLGSSTKEWRDLYIDGTANIDNLAADDATVTNNLDVQGLTTLDSTSVDGTLGITGNTTIGGTLGVTGAVTANAGVNVDNINIDGTTINLSSGSLTVSAATDIYLKPTGDDVFMQGVTSGEQLQFTLGTTEQTIAASDNLKLTGAEFTVDASGDITLDAGGGDIKGLKAGVQFVRFQQDNNNNVVIYSGDSAALSFDANLNLLIRSGQLYDDNLATTNKGTTDAINELKTLIDLLDSGASAQITSIGDLSALSTSNKTTIVAAINETYSRIPNIYDENDTLLN